jgi:polar amino acid transport system permease protein
MFVAEAAVHAWGLVLALLRGTRGRVTAPLRWLAVGYIDLFRAVPGIVLIYMIGFGIPIAAVPWLGTWSQYALAALALNVLYGAYVAEVYRAGIESIHWSQTAAARSLGLSHSSACRRTPP